MKRVFLFCAVLIFVVILIIRLLGIFAIHPDPWGVIENNVIFTIQEVLSGRPMYMNPEEPPFSITQYSPLYYHVNVVTDRLLGIGDDDLVQIYKVSRTLSLLFNIAFAFTVYLIANRVFSIKRQTAFIASILCFSILQPHSFSRPDSLFNFLFLLTIFAYLFYLKTDISSRQKILLLLTASVFSTLAAFSKQSGIILFLILFGFQVLFVRRNRDTALMLLFMLLSLLGCFFWLVQENASLFFMNAFKGLDNGISLSWFWHHIIVRYICTLQGLYLIYFMIFILPSLFLSKEIRIKFLAFSTFLSTCFAAGTALKMGSTPSYFTETFAMALVGGLLTGGKRETHELNYVWLYVLMMQFTSMVNPRLLIPVNKPEKFQLTDYSNQREVFGYFERENFLSSDDWVFIDEYAWDSFLTGIFHKSVLFPNKDIIEAKTVFNYREFDSLMARGKIKYVISKKSPSSFLQRQFLHYSVVDSLNGYRIYSRQ